MMELYKNSSDLNFNFVAESFDALQNCEKDGKCAISFSDSYETGSELDTMSHKQRNQANARERYRTHRYWFFEGFFDFQVFYVCESIMLARKLTNLSKFYV